MAAPTPPPPDPGGHPRRLQRFTRGQRVIHASLAALVAGCLGTAAVLYFGSLGALVGHRHVVAMIHLWLGLALPVPLVIGALASPAFRQDVRRLNRLTPGDWSWLRARDRRLGGHPSGKFNAGQKLNSAFTLAAVLVLLGTGLMLHYFRFFSDDLRTGATLVHDLFAGALAVVTAGHLWMAAHDPIARAGMRTGSVPREWAAREHALWAGAVLDDPEGRGQDPLAQSEPQ